MGSTKIGMRHTRWEELKCSNVSMLGNALNALLYHGTVEQKDALNMRPSRLPTEIITASDISDISDLLT